MCDTSLLRLKNELIAPYFRSGTAATAAPMKSIELHRMTLRGKIVKDNLSHQQQSLSLAWLQLHYLMSKIQSVDTSKMLHGGAVILNTSLGLKRRRTHGYIIN